MELVNGAAVMVFAFYLPNQLVCQSFNLLDLFSTEKTDPSAFTAPPNALKIIAALPFQVILYPFDTNLSIPFLCFSPFCDFEQKGPSFRIISFALRQKNLLYCWKTRYFCVLSRCYPPAKRVNYLCLHTAALGTIRLLFYAKTMPKTKQTPLVWVKTNNAFFLRPSHQKCRHQRA